MRHCHVQCLIAVCVTASCLWLAQTQGVHAEERSDRIDPRGYPHVHAFFQSIDLGALQGVPVADGNRWWCPVNEYIVPPQEAIEAFFRAAVHDRLTTIRSFALMAAVLHAEGVALCAPGDLLNAAVTSLHLDLGLALPLRELGAVSWLPQYDREHPARIMRIHLIYRKQYIHRFRKEILPVDLTIGAGEAVRFIDDGLERDGYLIGMDFHASDDRIGFDNIQGLAGRRQGVLGLVQRILFFLPDDIASLYVEDDVLVASALMTMRVPKFETTAKYQMRIHEPESAR